MTFFLIIFTFLSFFGISTDAQTASNQDQLDFRSIIVQAQEYPYGEIYGDKLSEGDFVIIRDKTFVHSDHGVLITGAESRINRPWRTKKRDLQD
ncbi:MAG: hypothetical protein GY869_16535 [Planctomycetes bacterium]|nr:hypothetical protein [Planctomycetota bacterium]